MLPIEEKTETIPAALEIGRMSGTASKPTVALSDEQDYDLWTREGILYTHDTVEERLPSVLALALIGNQ